MQKKDHIFSFGVYDSITELSAEDACLLSEAQKSTGLAYAPYSQFRVAAVARLQNGRLVTGTNQENASYPAGICAERVLLSTVTSMFSAPIIETIAISYQNGKGQSNHPISPCGICRQSLQEYAQRTGHPIRLVLGGMSGKVFVIPSASALLPLAFTSDELQ
jgi:cytidine deaminase